MLRVRRARGIPRHSPAWSTGAGHRDVPLAPPVLAQLLPGHSTPKIKLCQKGRRMKAAEVGGRERSHTFLTCDNGGEKTAAARSF